MRLWSNVRGFCATIWSSRMSSTAASNRRLEGKVAIVTASTDGGLDTISLRTIRSEERQLDDSCIRRQRIGFGIARQLVRDGAKVMISSRKQDRVSSAVSELENEERGCEVKGVVCHVAKPQHRKNLIEETLQRFGGIDILVSNAAVNPTFGPLLQTPEEAWDKIFDVNVKSAFLLAKDVIPLMEKRGGGSVVFISSIAGYQPMQGLGAYSISKTALLGLTKVLAIECAQMGVRVNCVAPGIIKTRFSEAIWKNEALMKNTLNQIPISRLGVADDIGGAVSFLSSDQASYITGETLVIAGGLQSRL